MDGPRVRTRTWAGPAGAGPTREKGSYREVGIGAWPTRGGHAYWVGLDRARWTRESERGTRECAHVGEANVGSDGRRVGGSTGQIRHVIGAELTGRGFQWAGLSVGGAGGTLYRRTSEPLTS